MTGARWKRTCKYKPDWKDESVFLSRLFRFRSKAKIISDFYVSQSSSAEWQERFKDPLWLLKEPSLINVELIMACSLVIRTRLSFMNHLLIINSCCSFIKEADAMLCLCFTDNFLIIHEFVIKHLTGSNWISNDSTKEDIKLIQYTL